MTLFAENAAIAGGCSAVMVRKHLFDRVGLFDESLRGFEDPDLWMRLAAVSGYQCIDETLAVILRREKSVSRNLDAMRASTLRSMRKNRVLLPARLRGGFWRNCLAGVYTDYAKPAYRAGRLGRAYADTLRALMLSPVGRGRLCLGLLRDFLLEGRSERAAARYAPHRLAGARCAMALLVARYLRAGLLVKSIRDFTRTGPEMAEEVLAHYRLYLAYSLARLVVFAFLIIAFMAFPGVAAYVVGLLLLGIGYEPAAAVVRGGRECSAADGSPVRAHVAVLPRRDRGLLPLLHDAFLSTVGSAYASPPATRSTWLCSAWRAAWLTAGYGRDGARRCLGGHVACLPASRRFTRRSTGGPLGNASPLAVPARGQSRSRTEHRADRLRHVARRPALRRGLSPRAHAQSGAPRQARHAVHRLLRPLRAHRTEPGLHAQRHLAASPRRARYLRHP